MAYTLQRLAPGSYDLLLDGIVIGSVVQVVLPGGGFRGWCAELLDDSSDLERPAPFLAAEHAFDTLGDVTHWLGSSAIIETSND